MGEQRRSGDWSGWTRALMVRGSRRRRLGRFTQVASDSPQLHITVSEIAGAHLNRTCMKGYNDCIHPKPDTEDPEQTLLQANAGTAFSWWSNMNAEERERAIAGAIAETATATTKGRSYAARRKK
jgi:hypothetical protein